jgi:gluconate 2-dehydrogenase
VYLAKPLPREVEQVLAERCEVRKWEGEDPIGYERLKREIGDAEGLIIAGGRIDAELLEHAPKLRAVSTISVGYDHLDIAAMKARGVIGTHTPYVLDDTVADLVFGLMLAAARRIPELDRLVKNGGWKKGDDRALFGVDVHHATLGIIGMGRIGEKIAKRAKFGFDMKVLYHNRSRRPEAEKRYGAEYRSLDDLLAESDFVVVMVSLTPETERFIRAEHFARMKNSAIFINASRGKVVDEPALIEALRQGRIRAAGLDVFASEPVDPSHPLLNMDNVVTLPHIGSATYATRFDMAMLAARNLLAALDGETPPNLIPEFRR